MRPTNSKPRRQQRGFTLIEMMIALVLMLVALVAMAKLVPASMLLNSANRYDSTALVLAQNELNQFVNQPLTAFTYTDPAGNPNYPCNVNAPCSLGSAAVTGAFTGSPLFVFQNQQMINFNAGTVGGYNFIWSDPNDASGAQYDVRWAVYTFAGGSGKRFIIGARRRGGDTPFFPVNIDTMVQK